MRRLWLIAKREIAAYATLPSFWVALLLGPVLIVLTGIAGVAAHHTSRPPPPQTVEIHAADPGLRAAAIEAIDEANRTLAARMEIAGPGPAKPDTVLSLVAGQDARLSILVQGAPVTPVASTLLREHALAVLQARILSDAGVPVDVRRAVRAARVDVASVTAVAPNGGANIGPQIGRFAIVMLLWLNLVGALGMLLQAIVRERTHRALEGLLASARPAEIIFGKLLGVGVLSMLVLGVWLGAGAVVAASPVGAAGAGAPDLLLAAFRAPETLIRASGIYIAAFVMYGSALIGLGAVAKDLPAAQNLSRPIFGVLLLVFFVALSQLTGASAAVSWLVWVPAFTPFVVLMAPPGSLSVLQVVGAFVVMLASTGVIAGLASMALTEKRPRWTRSQRDPGSQLAA